MKDQANPLVNNYLQAVSKNGITPFPQAIELLDFVSINLSWSSSEEVLTFFSHLSELSKSEHTG